MNGSQVPQASDHPDGELREPLNSDKGERSAAEKQILAQYAAEQQALVQSLVELKVIEQSQAADILSSYAGGTFTGTFREYVAGVITHRLNLDEFNRAMLLPFVNGTEDIASILARINAPKIREESLPVIPGFTFIKQLGKGGQGTVYLAQQKGLMNRLVAIKVFRNMTDEQLSRMRREVSASSSLPSKITHRVVITHDAQELPDGTGYYAVMEYIEGGENLGKVESGEKDPLSAEEVWNLAQNLLETLVVFEEEQVAHRDIKPGNILYAGETVKLGDFGLVKMDNQPTSFVTQGNAILGTPAYLDPENAQDVRFDVYSLGMTVRTLLAGKRPFATDHSIMSIINANRSFCHDMSDYNRSRRGAAGQSRSGTVSSPELVPQLKNPRTDYEKALAYLCERASLSKDDRPLPSVLLQELTERFPDIIGDIRTRNRVGAIQEKSRRTIKQVIIGGVLAAVAVTGIGVGVMKMERPNGNASGTGSGNGGDNTEMKKVEEVVESPPKPFAEMTEAEKQAYIEKIAVNAVGAPVLIDSKRFRLLGIDGLEIGPDNSAHVKDENNMAGVFSFDKEYENKIAEYFRKRGVYILGNHNETRRGGIWYRNFDKNGKDRGIFWIMHRVGNGACVPKGDNDGMESVFFPCIDDKFAEGLHIPNVANFVHGLKMPPRDSFIIPPSVGRHIKEEPNLDYVSFLEGALNALQEANNSK